MGQVLKVKEAEEPEGIIWENKGVGAKTRLFRVFLKNIIIFILFGLSFTASILLSEY